MKGPPAGTRRFDALVLGAGHNGLIAAAYLARAGLSTVVVERRETPGGCAASEEVWPGSRVPVGAHGLGALDPRVVRDLGLRRGSIEIVRPEAVLVAPHPDGAPLTLWRDPLRTADAIRP
ncbi:MAG: NAD(P)-binding protein, partial [Gemmatimonadota bacterium]|nr:NAD(P)-binding protein [Gemmatimonadota bacterium]